MSQHDLPPDNRRCTAINNRDERSDHLTNNLGLGTE